MILTHLEPSQPPSTTLSSVLSPRSNSLAIYPTTTPSITNTKNVQQQTNLKSTIYFAQYDYDQIESRDFLIETYTLFDSLQKIAREASGNSNDDYGYKPSALIETVGPTQIQYYNRISRLYREVIAKQFNIIEGDSELDEDAKLIALRHHATLHGILSLAEILYLPADGTGDGVVGEEILDWVNTVDRAPSAEEGQELADLSRPWEHVNFWPYIYTCILRAHLLSVTALLQLILTHPSLYLQSLASIPISLLTSFPRSTNYNSEREFLRSLTDWRTSVKRMNLEMEDLYSDAINDPVLGGRGQEEERAEWESGFRCLMELMEGREKRVLEVSEDWREALGAWGVWVNAGGRREGLPETMARITRQHPVDTTLPVESVQASLILGDVPRALQQSNLLSIWLVAHLSDLLQKVSVIDDSTTIPGALSLRDHFVLSYTDLLLADPSLWRVVVEYLSTCGDQGRGRMRLVLLGVDLYDIAEDEKVGGTIAEGGMEVDGSDTVAVKSGKKSKTVDDVLRVCAEQGLDEELRSVCKVYSEQLISQKRYGEAVSYCVRAGDGKRIARITERVLEEYIVNGQEAFIYHVDSIPTSLLRPNSTTLSLNLNQETSNSDRMDEQEESPLTPYSSRLSFLARYRDFFALYARGERKQAATLLVLLFSSNVAPKSFYAVMLLDVVPLLEGSELVVTTEEVYELLRCLEEVTANVATSGDIYGYLDSLARIVGGTSTAESGISKKDREVKALRQLEVVRGALARTLGRCFAQ